MNRRERDRFDALLSEIIDALPARLRELIEEAPVIVDDRAPRALFSELGMDPKEDILCGLHQGTPLTHRSVAAGHDLPETIHLFREGIIDQAGGWDPWEDDEGNSLGGEKLVAHEIRITLLHEIGHHFGLDEKDLARLGYD